MDVDSKISKNKLKFTFVMSERKSGQLLYIFDHKQLYSYASSNKNVKNYRCLEYVNGCKSKVFIDIKSNLCFVSKNWIHHSHEKTCSKRFKVLKFLEEVKTEISKPENKNEKIKDIFKHINSK